MTAPIIRRLGVLHLTALFALLLAACGGAPAAQPTAAPAASTEAPAAVAPTNAPTAESAPTAAPTPDTPPLKVIATYSMLGDFVQQVGGDLVELTTLVGPGGDSHTYEPTPQDSAALAEASVLFENGLEFESWIDDLYAASGSAATRVVTSENITPLPAAEEGHGHEEEGHEAEDTLAHACEHFEDEPEQIATGAAIPDDDTHYMVTLAGGEGEATLTRDEDAEVSFYLGADVPFTLAVGGAPLTPEASEAVSEGCDAIAIVYTFDLAPGDYTLSFGPNAGDSVALVWEEAAHAEGEEHAEGAEHAEDEEGHSHGEEDPHVWHDPANAMLMVESIRDALAAADPANAATYEANTEAYLAELEELDTFVQEEVATLPEERRKLVTSHDTFAYFAARYGFEIVGTALGAISTEVADPAAGELAELVEQIRAAGVPAIFAENVSNEDLMEIIAREAGVELAPTLYTDALGEPGSDGATYLEMMRYNVATIVTALAR
jgi:ABC-type Zn uptake system ZnuABC Zn-binding protein ZnuA